MVVRVPFQQNNKYPPIAYTLMMPQEDRLEWPDGLVERFLFVFGLPFTIGLSLTVPDCSRPHYEKYYPITFIFSIVWISFISGYMVSKNVMSQSSLPRK